MTSKFKLYQQNNAQGDLVGYTVIDPSEGGRVLAALDKQSDGSLKLTFLDGAKDPELWENEYFSQSPAFVKFNALEDQLIMTSGDVFETNLGKLSFTYFLTEVNGMEFELPAKLDLEKYCAAGKISFFEADKPRVDMLLVQEVFNGKSYLIKPNGNAVEMLVIAKFKKVFGIELPVTVPCELLI
jgi:hypothetical protein